MRTLRRLVSLAAMIGLMAVIHPASATSTEPADFVRGVYGRDSSPSGLDTIQAVGFNAVTAMPYKDHLDALHARDMKALVWLYGYDKQTCSFSMGDAEIVRFVEAIKGHPAILAYQIDDEPNYARVEGCPRAMDQVRARSDLVKSVDPSKPTYTVISTWDGAVDYPYEYWAGTTDIMGLDVYPCVTHEPTRCDYSYIDKAIAEAKADGVERFWAVIQAFDDRNWYRMPTATELEVQFDRWADSGMEGYFVYHWEIGTLDASREHQAVLARQNARSFTAGVDTTPPSAPGHISASWQKKGARLTWSGSTDDRGVRGYDVWRNGSYMGRVTGTSFSDSPARRRDHRYEVKAVDAAGNASPSATAVLVGSRLSRRLAGAKLCLNGATALCIRTATAPFVPGGTGLPSPAAFPNFGR